MGRTKQEWCNLASLRKSMEFLMADSIVWVYSSEAVAQRHSTAVTSHYHRQLRIPVNSTATLHPEVSIDPNKYGN